MKRLNGGGGRSRLMAPDAEAGGGSRWEGLRPSIGREQVSAMAWRLALLLLAILALLVALNVIGGTLGPGIGSGGSTSEFQASPVTWAGAVTVDRMEIPHPGREPDALANVGIQIGDSSTLVCPPRWPLGTVIEAGSERWICGTRPDRQIVELAGGQVVSLWWPPALGVE